MRFLLAARTVWVLFALLAIGADAEAQVQRPIGRYAADIRGFYSGLGQDPITAAALGLLPADLPKRALGSVVGLHVYPMRGRRLALGVGGELIWARGRLTPEADSSTTPPTLPTTPVVTQRLNGLSPQVSLNFGHRDGWSYLTAGMGPMRFDTTTGTAAAVEAGPRKNTINMGAGARWFASTRIAFTFDLRFYLTRPETTTATNPGRSRSRLRILSAGISVR